MFFTRLFVIVTSLSKVFCVTRGRTSTRESKMAIPLLSPDNMFSRIFESIKTLPNRVQIEIREYFFVPSRTFQFNQVLHAIRRVRPRGVLPNMVSLNDDITRHLLCYCRSSAPKNNVFTGCFCMGVRWNFRSKIQTQTWTKKSNDCNLAKLFHVKIQIS